MVKLCIEFVGRIWNLNLGSVNSTGSGSLRKINLSTNLDIGFFK